MNDPSFALSMEERRRLLEAHVAAGRFYRRELLRATSSWPVRYLKSLGAEEVLSVGSAWRVGYAPDTWTSLVDHLQSQGFGYGTMVRAGLAMWTDGGDAVDRHRDQLMFAARDRRLSPVGFVGIDQTGQAHHANPVTMIHRQSNVLLGVGEQMDLLGQGAIPVIVDDPIDAIAVSNASRQLNGQWAGIPVCGVGLSTAQARILQRFSVSDTVIVALSGDESQRNQTAGYVLDLAFFFDRVRGIELPAGATAASLAQATPERLNQVLSHTRPLMTYRASGRSYIDARSADPDPPDRGPGL